MYYILEEIVLNSPSKKIIFESLYRYIYNNYLSTGNRIEARCHRSLHYLQVHRLHETQDKYKHKCVV